MDLTELQSLRDAAVRNAAIIRAQADVNSVEFRKAEEVVRFYDSEIAKKTGGTAAIRQVRINT